MDKLVEEKVVMMAAGSGVVLRVAQVTFVLREHVVGVS